MSRRMERLNSDQQRNDSALSLALERQSSLRALTGRRAPAASQSWSSYNLRQDSLTDSTYETPASSIYVHDSVPPASSSPLKTSTPALHKSTVQASSTSSAEPKSGIVACDQCHTEFTGTYRRGNLARHVRHKHIGVHARVYMCRAGGCLKQFNRQDARLKHERNTHPELCRPSQARACGKLETSVANFREGEPASYATEGSLEIFASRACDPTAIEYANGDPGPTEEGMHDPISVLPVAAWRTFYQIHAGLDSAQYSQLCDSLFTRWATLAQELKDQGSHAYIPFARALADLHHVVEAIDCNIPEHDTEGGQRQQPPGTSQRISSRAQRRSTNLGVGNGAPRSSRSACYLHGQQVGQSQGLEAKGPKQQKMSDLQARKLDCPVYKHWYMWFQDACPPPCHGCSEQFMAQIRNHIKRTHVGQQGGSLTFFRHCVTCSENFVDYTSANTHACAHVPEPRGDPIIPWARLYLKLYPDASAIPSPWNGEPGWVSPSVFTRCQQVRSFLEERSRIQTTSIPPSDPQILVNDQLPYEALQATMLQEAISQAMLLGLPPTPDSQGLSNNRLSFIDQLNDAQARYLQLLREAPRFLLQPEIANAISLLVAIVDIVRAYGNASAALSINTQASAEGINNIFSDLALSPHTDRTTAPDTNALGPSGRNDYHSSPLEAANAGANLPLMQDGTNDLAFFDLGPDIGDVDVNEHLTFRHGF